MAEQLRADAPALRHVIVAGTPLPGQQALAELLREGEAFTAEGFYRPGDLVRRVGRHVYAERRTKDTINRGGELPVSPVGKILKRQLRESIADKLSQESVR